MMIKGLRGSLPSERLPRSAVERSGHGLEIADAVSAEVGAFGEVLAEQAIGVLVRAALPRAVGVTEEDRHAGLDTQLSMLGHLGTLVPGKGSAELLREGRDRSDDGIPDRLGAMAGQSRAVVRARPAMALHAGQVEEHREPGGALDERPDRRTVQPKDKVTFPVAGHGSVVCFSRSFADHDLGRDELLAAPLGPGSRHTQRPPGPQTGDEFAAQGATPLDVEGLVNGLVRDPHRLIMREVDPQPVSDLLGAP